MEILVLPLFEHSANDQPYPCRFLPPQGAVELVFQKNFRIMRLAIIFFLFISLHTLLVAAAPYYAARLPVPGRIEAEDYDRGGEGVGFSDTVRIPSRSLQQN